MVEPGGVKRPWKLAFVLFALGSMIATPHLAGGDRYERELWTAVNAGLEERGARLSEGGRGRLAEVVREAAERLAADGGKERLGEARENARALGRAIGSSPAGKQQELGRGEIDGVLKRVCPLYPFCSRKAGG